MAENQKLKKLGQALEKNLAARKDVYRELGSFLFAHTREQDDCPMAEYREEALELESRISLTEERIAGIGALETRLGELKEVDEALRARKRNCRENLSLLRETLGEELYNLAKNRAPDVPWAQAFDTLDKNISKIRDKEALLFQLEADDEGPLGAKVLGWSKRFVLKSGKKRMEHSLGKSCKNAFNQAVLLGAGKEGDPAAELLAPFFREEQIWQDILKEEEELEKEGAQVKSRQKELWGNFGSARRMETLKKEKERDQQLLHDKLTDWGEGAAGDVPGSWAALPEVARAMESLDKLTEEAVEINLETAKEETLMEVENLQNELVFMEDKIEKREQEIQRLQEELRSLKKEMGAVRKKMEKKLKSLELEESEGKKEPGAGKE